MNATKLLLTTTLILTTASAFAGQNLVRTGAVASDFESPVLSSSIADPIELQPTPGTLSETTDAYQAAGDRLASLQNNDGGWDWPLDDGDPNNVSPLNTLGPIGKGLAEIYQHTLDPDHLTALANAAGLLLTKTNNFSPGDGYLAAQLDEVFGGTTYVDFVMANFYNPLTAGTYDKNGAGILYDTEDYVNLIRDARASQGYPNLAAWDVGAGLVGAVAVNAPLTDWITGVTGEIDELDGADSYDVIGLAGAVYALAVAGEDYDPVAGEHIAASNLSELADILATYQISSGGFAWNSDYVIPDDFNEETQETAYAMLALAAVDSDNYLSELLDARDYMLSIRLPEGGLYSYWGENNEVTAEGFWGVSVTPIYTVSLTADNELISAEDCAVQDPDHLPCLDRSLVTFGIDAGPSNGAWRSVTVHFSYDVSYLEIVSIERLYDAGGLFSVFDEYEISAGLHEVTLSIYGVGEMEDEAQNLFNVTFDGLVVGATPDYIGVVEFDEIFVRDYYNQPMESVPGAPLDIQIDNQAPAAIPDDFFGPGSEPFCGNGDPIPVPGASSDNIELDRIEYKVDTGIWRVAPGAGNIGGPNWAGPWFLNPDDPVVIADGLHTLTVRVWDAVGYVSAETSDDFIIDRTAPGAVTDLDATPQHIGTNLSWSVPAGHTGPGDCYELFRAKRLVYPYEGGLTDANIWDGDYISIAVITDPAQTTYQDLAFTDNSDAHRAVYDYILVAFDCIHSESVSNRASATNYFLGDWDANDGEVKVGDLGMLSTSYGTSGGDLTWDAELDIAPTSDYSSYGLPGPDNRINFEDLIIFSMNYGPGGPPIPISSWEELITKAPTVDSDLSARLIEEEGSIRFELTGVVKGVSASILTDRVLVNATSTTGQLFWYRDDGVWHIDLVSLQGNLENPVILLNFEGAGAMELSNVDARDQYNRLLMSTLEETETSELPTSYTLSQNYPNPFNPATTISYTLPEAVQVRLTVFNTVGQQVATVVNNMQQPGVYSVTLEGSRWASGIYFYRLEAGSFTELRKMVLLK